MRPPRPAIAANDCGYESAGGPGASGHAERVDADQERRDLIDDLPAALASNALYLEYQPKFRLRARRTTALEALVRWRHHSHGVLPPVAFIEAAERWGRIRALTLWTLDRALSDQRQLKASGHDLPIFVNISGALLNDANFVGEALARLTPHADRIGFEITETAVISDPDTAIANLKLFADAGIVIAIDDYGAGLSSLIYLKQLPAKELKIDKQFIMNLSSSHRDPLIVRSTIDLAHALEMEVTAEGVESEAALALLTVMGCDMAQGFLIQHPASVADSIKFLDEEAASAADVQAYPFRRLAEIWKAS